MGRDHSRDAMIGIRSAPGRDGVFTGRNGHGFKAWGPSGQQTTYYGSAIRAMAAYDRIYGNKDSFGQSSLGTYFPGISASSVDSLILKPRTASTGTRGVRVNFGSDEFPEDEDDYGRLYRSPAFHQLVQASPGDRGALQGRSGGSGYRGGRPTFGGDPQVYGGARLEFGPIRYEGSPWGAAALGLAGLLLLYKGPLGS